MENIGRMAPDCFLDRGIASKRPRGSKRRSQEPCDAGSIEFACPNRKTMDLVTMPTQKICFELDDGVFSSPAGAIFVVNLKNFQ